MINSENPAASQGQAMRVVAVGFLIMAFVYAPGTNLVGLFVLPVAETFGVSQTASTFMVTVGIACSLVGSATAGKLLTRFPFRLVICAMLLVDAVSYVALSFAPAIGFVYLFFAFIGFCNTVVTVVPIAMTINNWFEPSIRGKYLGIAMVGSGFGAMLLTPAIGYIIENHGWRNGYRFFAMLQLLILPLVALLFLRSPKEKGLSPYGAGRDNAIRPISTMEKMGTSPTKMPAFWLLFASFLLIAGTTQTWNTNGAAVLNSMGFSVSMAANILSITAIGLIIGKPLLGVICDWKGAKIGLAVGVSAIALSYVLYVIFPGTMWPAYVAAPVLGFGMATNTITQPLTVSDFFRHIRFSA